MVAMDDKDLSARQAVNRRHLRKQPSNGSGTRLGGGRNRQANIHVLILPIHVASFACFVVDEINAGWLYLHGPARTAMVEEGFSVAFFQLQLEENESRKNLLPKTYCRKSFIDLTMHCRDGLLSWNRSPPSKRMSACCKPASDGRTHQSGTKESEQRPPFETATRLLHS